MGRNCHDSVNCSTIIKIVPGSSKLGCYDAIDGLRKITRNELYLYLDYTKY